MPSSSRARLFEVCTKNPIVPAPEGLTPLSVGGSDVNASRFWIFAVPIYTNRPGRWPFRCFLFFVSRGPIPCASRGMCVSDVGQGSDSRGDFNWDRDSEDERERERAKNRGPTIVMWCDRRLIPDTSRRRVHVIYMLLHVSHVYDGPIPPIQVFFDFCNLTVKNDNFYFVAADYIVQIH